MKGQQMLRIDENDLVILDKLLSAPNPEPITHRLFWNILLLNDFKDFTKKIRSDFKIPNSGYHKSEQAVINANIYNKKTSKEIRSGKNDVTNIQNKIKEYIVLSRGLHPEMSKDNFRLKTILSIIFNYIFWGEVCKNKKNIGNFSIIPGEHMFADKIRIEFSVNSRIDDVTKFIKDHWSIIKQLQADRNLIEKTPSRNMTHKKISRDIKIYNCYIDSLSNHKGSYPEIEIKKTIKAKYDLILSEDVIRKTIERINKEISEINLDK